MAKKSFPLSKVHQLLGPGPVIMVSTSHQGKDNVMSMSWHMMVDFDPPLVAFVMDENSHSFEMLKKTKECVINIPTVELIKTVVAVGRCSGSEVDKFEKFKIKKEAASKVKAPIVSECYASLECKVIDTKMVSKYNIFILEVLKAWVTSSKKRPKTIHHCGETKFIVDGALIRKSYKK
jgi:flavin reductase (DIM6/NTAB) family NADH-FMN oxidoreductase RutF